MNLHEHYEYFEVKVNPILNEFSTVYFCVELLALMENESELRGECDVHVLCVYITHLVFRYVC